MKAAGARVCVLTVVLASLAASAHAAKPPNVLARFATPGSFAWTVPNGVKLVSVDAFGAQGGDVSDGSGGTSLGGRGGEATVTITVKPGQVLEIVVGGQGGLGTSSGESPSWTGGGANGGGSTASSAAAGGGGASDVRVGTCAAAQTCDLNARILVAAGGGGSGLGAANIHQDGGAGGGSTGAAGTGTIFHNGAGGGTQTNGGAGTATDGPPDYPGSPGSFGDGGFGGCNFFMNSVDNTSRCISSGGGGGAGWFGGGGGAEGTGGGGGSSYITPLASSGSLHTGVESGDGLVTISKG